MQFTHAPLISFLLVVGAHIGALATIVLFESEPKPIDIVIPTIQGVLVMAQPEITMPTQPVPPLSIPPPPPEKKTEPKPAAKSPPKAPPSERAVKAPEAPPSVEQSVAPKPVKPAPSAPVVPPRAEAGQLSNPAPAYPGLSRRLREQGAVVLDILIKADGTVGEIKINSSSGFKRLDESAIKAVSRWHYQPATQGGKKIDFWYEQPVEFNLR